MLQVTWRQGLCTSEDGSEIYFSTNYTSHKPQILMGKDGQLVFPLPALGPALCFAFLLTLVSFTLGRAVSVHSQAREPVLGWETVSLSHLIFHLESGSFPFNPQKKTNCSLWFQVIVIFQQLFLSNTFSLFLQLFATLRSPQCQQ